MPKTPFKSLTEPPPDVTTRTRFGVGRHVLSTAKYNAILDWIRVNDPDNTGRFSRKGCAEAVGVNPATVKKAWEKGWPNRKTPLPPIKDARDNEMLMARSERTRAQMAAVEEARAVAKREAVTDAVRTRKQEGLMVQATRTLAGKLLTQTVKMAQGVELLTHDLVDQIRHEYAGRDAFGDQKKTVNQKLKIVREVQSIARDSAQLAETAMILERKFMGEPEKVLGIEHMGIEEAVAELYAGAQAIQRIRKGKVIDVDPTDETEDDIAMHRLLPSILDQIEDPEGVLNAAGVPLDSNDDGD